MVQSKDNSGTSRDFGARSRAFLRIAGRRTGENRYVRALYRAGGVTARSTGRVARVLWLEVTGFFFLCLAVVGIGASLREYRRYLDAHSSLPRVAVAIVFTLLFIYFGVNSFWRSRKPAP